MRSRERRKLFLFVAGGFVLLVLFFACADRERENPLDPLNSQTFGKPVGLDVVSFGKKIVLTWHSFQVNGLTGTRIYRQSVPDSSYREIAFVSGSQSDYEDKNVEYGVKYYYKIQMITESYQTPLSDAVKIIPGPSYVWGTTGNNGTVFKLTHDASHRIFERNIFLSAEGITGAGTHRGVWVTDYYLDQIVRIGETGQPRQWYQNFDSPVDIAYDSVRQILWIAEQISGRIVLMDTSGARIAELTDFLSPSSVSVNVGTGFCWVADPHLRAVIWIDPETYALTRLSSLLRPEDVDVNPRDESCWVADSSRVLKVNRGGNFLLSVTGFHWATDVAANPNTGQCWVIDWQPGADKSRVVLLSATGEKVLEMPGFYNPQSLDVDPFDGSCVVADTWNSRVVKISSAGEIIGEWQGRNAPKTIKVISP